jgi:hypothetical protein
MRKEVLTPGGTEDNHETLNQDTSYSDCDLNRTFRIQATVVTDGANLLG